MTTQDVATAFAALCIAGKWDEAGDAHWSDAVVSIEPMGPTPVATGREALLAKRKWWYDNHEIHSATAEGPYIHGEQFAMRFSIDMTAKAMGNQRMQLQEVGLYTVRDGKIVEERFFYGS